MAIWRDVPKVDEVGIDDDFFEIGGDSLLSIRVIARAGREGLRVLPERFFEQPTVRRLRRRRRDLPGARGGICRGAAELAGRRANICRGPSGRLRSTVRDPWDPGLGERSRCASAATACRRRGLVGVPPAVGVACIAKSAFSYSSRPAIIGPAARRSSVRRLDPVCARQEA